MTSSKANASSLFYSIQQPPQLGRLVNSQLGSAMGDVKNFTQAEVSAFVMFPVLEEVPWFIVEAAAPKGRLYFPWLPDHLHPS